MDKKLTKSADKMLAGICGGIAEYFEIDSSIVRIIYVLGTLFSAGFPGILLYLLLWIILPPEK